MFDSVDLNDLQQIVLLLCSNGRMAGRLRCPLGKTVVARQALERPSLPHLSRPAGYRTSSLVSLARVQCGVSHVSQDNFWLLHQGGLGCVQVIKKIMLSAFGLLFNNVKIAKSRLHSNI